jgi:hypothetical protein
LVGEVGAGPWVDFLFFGAVGTVKKNTGTDSLTVAARFGKSYRAGAFAYFFHGYSMPLSLSNFFNTSPSFKNSS